MAKENKDNKDKQNKPTKKNPNSIYWIYAAIGIAIIGIQLFMSSSTTKQLQSKQTFLTLMEEGFVENTILWRNVGRVDFRISESGKTAVLQGDFTGADFEIMKRSMNNSGKTLGTASPQFSFDIASTEAFIKEFEAINDKRKAEGFDIISYKVDEEHNYVGQIFSFLLPIIIIIAFWMFIMRRMSGGAGAGGAGVQVVTVGKSKAKVFE